MASLTYLVFEQMGFGRYDTASISFYGDSMIRFFLNIFLAILIVSCPIRCQLGWSQCCCDESEAQSVVLDCCCETTRAPDDCSNSPEEDGQQCKCICSGATIPDHFELAAADVVAQPVFIFDFPVVVLTTDLRYCERYPSRETSLDPSGSGNVGRQMRCLHCSLTI